MTLAELIERLQKLQTNGSIFVDNPEVVLHEPQFARWFAIEAVQIGDSRRIEIVSGPEWKP